MNRAIPVDLRRDTPTFRKRDDKRKRILQAAGRVWLQRGISTARVEEIAREAGVSKGTIYNFFHNKEELFIATVMEPYDDFRENMSAQLDAIDDPCDRLRATIDALCEGFQPVSEHRVLQQQAWSVVAKNPAARDRMFGALREIYAAFYERITTSLEQGRRSGQIRLDVDVSVAATSWIAIFDGLTYRNAFDPELCGRGPAVSVLRDCLESLLQQAMCEPRDEIERRSAAGDAR